MHSVCLKSIKHVLPGKSPGKVLQHPHGYAAPGIETLSRRGLFESKAILRPASILIVHFQKTSHLKKNQPPEFRSEKPVLSEKIGGTKRRAPSLDDSVILAFEDGAQDRVPAKYGCHQSPARRVRKGPQV